ncbi:M23 family metallopeptidase [Amphibacillus sediminis]|uniref:M23 family metallopeptidase n=1 Tax=Amphibacillus sediminis TaxID=360185 RepID=UPI0008344DA8|nr:M23 family metallopeptidase [Amphibacillus sediminis]
MKKDLDQIRKDIIKRKQQRLKTVQIPNRVEETERPSVHSTQKPSHQDQIKSRTPLFVKQLLIASAFFLFTVMFLQSDSNQFEKSRSWLYTQLVEDFPFATVNVWYQEQFGVPFGFFVDQSTVPTYGQLAFPVSGTVSQPFNTNGQGVLIQVDDQPEVFSIEQGTVIFAGNDRQTEKTVIIQHPDRTKSIYGFLDQIDVTPYQFVYANQKIGQVAEGNNGNLYFSLQKNNQYIDPIEVIPVDDN